MDKAQKQHILNNMSSLAQHTKLTAYVFTSFVTTGVLEVEDVLLLDDEANLTKRKYKLYEIVMAKPIPNIYDKLVYCLESTEHDTAVEILRRLQKTELTSILE